MSFKHWVFPAISSVTCDLRVVLVRGKSALDDDIGLKSGVTYLRMAFGKV